MRKILLYLMVFIATGSLLSSCDYDVPNAKSIFIDDEDLNELDEWLVENYVYPYNIDLRYRMVDYETDFYYNVVPARYEKSEEMAKVIKHVWLEAYSEAIGGKEGIDFIRMNCPKFIHFLGSAEFNQESGTIRQGSAEGAMKITIAQVNDLDVTKIRTQDFFGAIHHEFGHILHQTIDYPKEFKEISQEKYNKTSWHQEVLEDVNKEGFITLYAKSGVDEDFVELLARYVTWTRAEWNAMLEIAGEDGAEGAAIIEQKLGILRSYMLNTWSVDLEKLHTVVQMRVSELETMDLDDLY